MRAIKTVLLCGVAVAAVSGCDRIGSPIDALTGSRPPPDEFAVVTRQPLQMPASGQLPEPRLGAPSPREHNPFGDARTALTGSATAPTGAATTAGEQALLSAAETSAASGATGVALSAAEAEATRYKPYEAPTLMELLNLDGEKAEDVLDPNAEARRLRTDGSSPTPVNPADAPAPGESDDGYVSPGEKYNPKFPYGNQRKGT